MRNIFLMTLLFLGSIASAQNNWGFSIAYSTEDMLSFDIMFKDTPKMLNSDGFYHIGFAWQDAGQHGSRRRANTSNYGRTAQGGSHFFTGLDLGYSKQFGPIRVHGEGTVGADTYFTNYRDYRFTTGGYYSVNGTEARAGYGGDIAYVFNFGYGSALDFYAGYHSIKGANFGMRFIF